MAKGEKRSQSKEPEELYMAWAMGVAEEAFSIGGKRMQIPLSTEEPGWVGRRRRAAIVAVSSIQGALGQLAKNESLREVPQARFDPDGQVDPEGLGPSKVGSGALCVGGFKRMFWPVWRSVDYTDSDIDIAPGKGQPISGPHRAKVAVTFFYRLVAEMMIADRAAKSVFMEWAREAALQAKEGEGPWASAHAKHQEFSIGSVSQVGADASSKRPRL